MVARWTGLWRIGVAGVFAILLVAVLLVTWKPTSSGGLENGSFENDCCGKLTLHDGRIILEDGSAVRYTLGQDARGFYVLPKTYVGGYDEVGFEVDGSRPTAKLRLDRMPHPTSIIVPGLSTTYRFDRRLPPAP